MAHAYNRVQLQNHIRILHHLKALGEPNYWGHVDTLYVNDKQGCLQADLTSTPTAMFCYSSCYKEQTYPTDTNHSGLVHLEHAFNQVKPALRSA